MKDGDSKIQARKAPLQEKNQTLGLVLEGGGAKGAFAFGVLQTFRDAGLQFHAVSGTSVGALNAVLWATGSLDDGEKIWSNLSLSKIFRSNYGWWRWLIAGPAIYVSRIYSSFYGARIADPALRKVRFIFGFAFVSPLMLLASPIFGAPSPMLGYGLGTFLSLCIAHMVSDEEGDVTPHADRRIMVLVAFSIAYLLVALTAIFLALKTVSIWLGYLGVCLSLVLFVKCVSVFFAVTHDSSPLRSILDPLLDCQLSCPVYVTTATARELWCPDSADTGYRSVAGGHFEVKKKYREYVPVYHELTSIGDREIRLTCVLASAALPLGLVKSVELHKTKHVDGGVADNCPLFPLLDLETITTLIVVHLSTEDEAESGRTWPPSGIDSLRVPNVCRTAVDLTKCWERFHRLVHLSRFCETATYENNLKTISEATFRPSRSSLKTPRVLHVFPKQTLGGFFGGTLNFSSKTAHQNIEKGRARGKEFLSENGLLNSI